MNSDLSHLVAEIRALRGQLEQSIQVNNCLRLQLEHQLDGGGSTARLSPSANQEDPGNKQPLFQGRKEKGTRRRAAGGASRQDVCGGRDHLTTSTPLRVRVKSEVLRSIALDEGIGFRLTPGSDSQVCHI